MPSGPSIGRRLLGSTQHSTPHELRHPPESRRRLGSWRTLRPSEESSTPRWPLCRRRRRDFGGPLAVPCGRAWGGDFPPRCRRAPGKATLPGVTGSRAVCCWLGGGRSCHVAAGCATQPHGFVAAGGGHVTQPLGRVAAGAGGVASGAAGRVGAVARPRPPERGPGELLSGAAELDFVVTRRGPAGFPAAAAGTGRYVPAGSRYERRGIGNSGLHEGAGSGALRGRVGGARGHCGAAAHPRRPGALRAGRDVSGGEAASDASGQVPLT
mmetsp:Transcript_6242/g.21427  ORF Transcript_6242/g.21427 Transcript_6242/m.21427 type:complete len:268 (-) Transcript_6242:454-1257(-)